jgi:trehalose-6-phosphate synthase
MPKDERRERLTAIRSWVREHDLAAWIELQLQALDAEELQSPV